MTTPSIITSESTFGEDSDIQVDDEELGSLSDDLQYFSISKRVRLLMSTRLLQQFTLTLLFLNNFMKYIDEAKNYYRTRSQVLLKGEVYN